MKEWRAYVADRHLCGVHLSESVERLDHEVPKYVAAYETCHACQAIEHAQREQAKKDKDDTLKSGRMWRAYTPAQVAELTSAGRATR